MGERRDYWDCIFERYHPPSYSHPGTCPGCVLDSPRWGTPVEQERRDACHCVSPDLSEVDCCRRCGAKPTPNVLRIIHAYDDVRAR